MAGVSFMQQGEQTEISLENIQIGEHTLTLRDIHANDEVAVVDLHTLVFGPQVDARWFRWKYGQASNQGKGQAVGVWHGDTLIAFCGGVPRSLDLHGKNWNGLQLTDVMVHPQWRGILTRKGPFYHASSRFYRTRMGTLPTHPFQLGFGFPSQIHMRLAEKIGLAWDAGQIQMLRWKPSPPAAINVPWTWRWQEIIPQENSFDKHIHTAWAAMKSEASGVTIGHRDAAYVHWRYVDRPLAVGAGSQVRYRYFALRRPWSRWASGVAIMDLRSPSAHWLDWIGSTTLMPLVVHAIRCQAAQSGASEVTAWASPLIVQHLEHTGIHSREVCAWLGIPANSTIQKSDISTLNWWLMGGDTDFL